MVKLLDWTSYNYVIRRHVIPYLRLLAIDVYLDKRYCQTLSRGMSIFLLLSSDYKVLSSAVMAQNNFIQYNHYQVVQLLPQKSFLTNGQRFIVSYDSANKQKHYNTRNHCTK